MLSCSWPQALQLWHQHWGKFEDHPITLLSVTFWCWALSKHCHLKERILLLIISSPSFTELTTSQGFHFSTGDLLEMHCTLKTKIIYPQMFHQSPQNAWNCVWHKIHPSPFHTHLSKFSWDYLQGLAGKNLLKSVNIFIVIKYPKEWYGEGQWGREIVSWHDPFYCPREKWLHGHNFYTWGHSAPCPWQ